MIIKSNSKNYSVTIYTGMDQLKKMHLDDDTFAVIDKKVYELYEAELFSDIAESRRYVVEAAEENKTMDTVLAICGIMTKIPAKRNAKLISFGGGIVQDITGFVANVLYRGIKWIFYPTTLLAACDSCIGGKTSLNYKHFKNLLGTFYPPDEIHICTPFFKTLLQKDFYSGLGEVVKFNVMSGGQGILNMENNIDLLLERNDDKIREFVESSLRFKKWYIEEDEFDRGVRIKLNFAHTFGHAFETVSTYTIPHGTAVAMGMIVADRISYLRGWLMEDQAVRIEMLLLSIIQMDIDDSVFHVEGIIKAMRKDKKQTGKGLTAVLMKKDMELEIVHDVNREEVETAVGYLCLILKNNRISHVGKKK